MMNRRYIYICLIGLLVCSQSLLAQESGEMIRGKVMSDDPREELVSATVLEIDATGRVITNALTDLNGEFSMKIKNTRNKLRFSYLGFAVQEVAIGTKRNFEILMKENNTLTEVVVTGKRTVSSGGMDIPYNEVPFAMQRISSSTFEGISVASIDDALQGHIAGLDIVGSGNVGVGAQMRLRGVSSLSANANPLIVINGVQRPDIATSDFDFNSASEQQFADLLMLNPDDIEDVSVLKDAGATAIYGSRGAAGVLLINTKKGVSGPTKVNYTYKYSGSIQPQGLKMLNGNDYTMLMKQAYFNPNQSSSASDIPEFSYDPSFSEYKYYNNNTDWREAVLQYGSTHDHYLAISGGGERAKFRVTGGYLSKEGTVIGQKWNRLTSRMNLDYRVSSRILFSTDFSFTYSDNDQNWSDGRGEHGINGKSILYLAYKKMPNMSIYNKDENGNDLSTYYNMLKSSTLAKSDQGILRNPVALARLATNNNKSYDILPTLRLQYELLDPTVQTLRYEVYVSFDMKNNKEHKFLPKEVASEGWGHEDINRVDDNDAESFGIQSENRITWKPKLGEKHHLSTYVSFHTSSGTTNRQHLVASGYPTGKISDPSSEGYIRELTSGLEQWRSMDVNAQLHYSYQSRYIAYATLHREGSTRFGKDHKWGYFPGVSLRWNLNEEPFWTPLKNWVNIFAFRPSWGISGHAPDREYLHFSSYAPWSSYGNVSTIRPENLRLSDLRWEKTTEYNLGMDMELLDNRYSMDANLYYRKTTDLLTPSGVGAPIPSSTGYDNLVFRNVGSMKNVGWEINMHGNRFVRAGNFSMDGYFNLANTVNTLISLDEGVLRNYNKDLQYDSRNAPYLQRLQTGHAYGSIYGFRYKGVYQYNIDNPDLVASGYTLGTAPITRDENGNVILDSKGKPLSIYYNYGPTGINYQFQGGDAIYEDVNNDGSIDELDIVYLGNCNPKLTGGFGLTFRWKSLSVNTFFTFRYGNKVINITRREAENMLTDNNQSIATNWRWRREGDVTQMPRALHDFGYNSLPSDRYVEDGSFVRFKYITLNYNIPSNWVKKYAIKQMNLYATINNLWCFTKYQGVDPEISYGSMGLSQDESITPRSKDFTVGLTIGF